MTRDMAGLGEAKVRKKEPFAFPMAGPLQHAADAYRDVLKSVGATKPVRDAVDKRIVADADKGTGHVIDSQDEVGGWPEYKSAEPPADADHDGMPDDWERARGLDPNDPADGPKDRNGDGYTNVEEYLNELAG